ncbi:hypothetical protein TIFTF001_000400 [Ficus carica]|uniref:Pentatricopeptide repeat-containing protein n=1 Tax=Ficus carica TaxID=3494 RepID=A0AA87Z4H5_FICCA|nr:hypothetical protein TIFTF001_000400 [Ficus carica]
MSFLLLSNYQLRRTIEKAAKAGNRVVSRTFTTQNEHYDGNPGDDFAASNVKIVEFNQKQSDENDFKLFAQLLQHGSSPNPRFLNKLVSFCAKLASFDTGIQVHTAIFKLGFCSSVYICSALVDMYAKCGTVSNAQKVFDEMSQRNVVTWSSLISGYLQADCPKTAIGLFRELLEEGMSATAFSFSGAVLACSQLGNEELGTQVHCLSLKMGLCDNVVVGTGLVDMYSNCSNLENARRVFNQLPDKNVITWTSMVNDYAQYEQPDEAMVLVREMLRLDLKPTCVTYNILLSSFSRPDFFNYCRQIHCHVIRVGLDLNEHVAVTLVTTYSKCSNSLEDFQKLCSRIRRWDNIAWNAVISGFSNLGIGKRALKCFSDMRKRGVYVDRCTLSSVLRASATMSALEEGRQIHALVCKSGHVCDICIQNGIVSMYARCGAIDDSKRVFAFMDEHDVISWNSLLSGCSRHGLGWETVELFEHMRRTDIKPNDTTFLIVLTACSHVGLLDKGLEYFNLMRSNDFLASPRMEHYATIVDLYGRAGNLREAEEFIDNMPVEPGPSIYKALLSASQVHGNTEIAFRSAKRHLEICPDDPAIYILLGNVLKTNGYWNDAAELRKIMLDRGVGKYISCSWI